MNSRQRRRNRIIKKQYKKDEELAHRASFGIVLSFINNFSASFELFKSEEFTKERIIEEIKKSIDRIKEEVEGCKTIKEVCELIEKEDIKFTKF